MTDQSTDVEYSDGRSAISAAMPPLDIEKYRQYVDDFDVIEERKLELLQTLWSIMYSFVLAGFGVDSVRRCLPALTEIASEEESSEVEEAVTADEFNRAAERGMDGPE